MNFKIESWWRLAGTRSVRFLFDLGVDLESYNKNPPTMTAGAVFSVKSERYESL